ncbi:hypothetical protein ASD97_39630 [Streptomyces sp. Root63]|nr:hypothetical protein ASD97_39630 [Streptomyces sp. Root63]
MVLVGVEFVAVEAVAGAHGLGCGAGDDGALVDAVREVVGVFVAVEAVAGAHGLGCGAGDDGALVDAVREVVGVACGRVPALGSGAGSGRRVPIGLHEAFPGRRTRPRQDLQTPLDRGRLCSLPASVLRGYSSS